MEVGLAGEKKKKKRIHYKICQNMIQNHFPKKQLVQTQLFSILH